MKGASPQEKAMTSFTECFPGHADAGKILSWITRQISNSALGKDLESRIREAGGAQTDPR